MSVCDPSSPDACEKCKTGEGPRVVQLTPRDGRPAGKSRDEWEELLADLQQVRRDARALTRSGHPGVRAEALRCLRKAEDDIRWLKIRISKDEQ